MKIKYLIILICGVLSGCNSDEGGTVNSNNSSNTENNRLPNNEFEGYLSNSYQIEPSSIQKMCEDKDISCEMINSEAIITVKYGATAIDRQCFVQYDSPLKKLVWNISKSYMSVNVAMGFHSEGSCVVDGYNRKQERSYISEYIPGKNQYFYTSDVSESSAIKGSTTEYTLSSLVRIDSSLIAKEPLKQLITGFDTIPEGYHFNSFGFGIFVDNYVVSLSNASHDYGSEVVDINMEYSDYYGLSGDYPILELIEKTWQ